MVALVMPLVLVSVGTIGYCLIERWSLFDSLYMAVITLTTVGFREVHELSAGGQAFTMLLALGGVFTLFYAATSVIGFIVGGQVEQLLESRRMERTLSELESHFIVCGYGRMGRYVCQEFSQQGLPFAVVDNDAEQLDGFELPHGVALHGDATSDEILRRVGVGRARALVTVVASDADNLYITLSARLLNERLFIVARADDERSEQKLLRAGASRVVSPYVIGGNRMAQAVLRPAVVDFLELATRTEHLELNIEEAKINERSKLVGLAVAESPIEREHKVILVAIKKPTGKMVFNPSAETRLENGDTLIMLGGRHALDQIAELASINGG